MKGRIIIQSALLGFASIIALNACTDSNALVQEPVKKILITGSSTVAPLMSEISKRYESQHPNIRIDVQTGGSTRGVVDAQRNLSDIGMASRALKSSEQEMLSFTIASDGIGIIVHDSNNINDLTKKQVIDIYMGRVTNWKELGGEDKKITVVTKAEGRSTRELFLKHFGLKGSEHKAHIIIGDNEQGIKTIEGNKSAIGYVSIGAAEYNISKSVEIKLVSLDGVVASIESVKNGAYPLSRPLNLVTAVKPIDSIKDIIKFAQSSEVHDIVQQHSFIPASQ